MEACVAIGIARTVLVGSDTMITSWNCDIIHPLTTVGLGWKFGSPTRSDPLSTIRTSDCFASTLSDRERLKHEGVTSG